MNITDRWVHFLMSLAESGEVGGVWYTAIKQTSVVKLENGLVFLTCPNAGVKTLVLNRQAELILLLNRALEVPVLGVHCDVVKQIKKTPVAEDTKVSLFEYEPSFQELVIQSGLNPKNSFENYAVSHCNNVAYAACQVVVGQMGKIYNPLFIWGGVGVGKTHLAQATANRILQLDRTRRVYFCPGDKFTNEIIEAIRTRSTEKFRQKYRRLDVLVVDDIQFIAGKDTVQQEFFHTFNEIVSRGGQVILISDRPPVQIKDIEDRLRSRFTGGLTIDISPPDFELKTAILIIKARERGINIDIEAAKEIAEQAEDNRMLEGILLSSYAKMLATKTQNVDDLILGKDNISSLLSGRERPVVRVTPEQVLVVVCSFYQVKPLHIRQQNRAGKIARIRHILMFVLREKLEMNLEEIARFLRRKDHTTVLHGVQKVRETLIHDTLLKGELDAIVKNLNLPTRD